MKKAAILAFVAGLSACAATAPQYYSLQVPTTGEESASPAVERGYAISMQPVIVPQQVARPQIVVSTTASAEVVPLNAALWAGPLEAQIRNTLSDGLSRKLGVVDVGQSGAADDLPVWRIYVDVQRFDSVYGESVQHDIVWRMVPHGMRAKARERVCSAQISLPVGTGMSALVEGHRRALDALSGAMAAVLASPQAAQPAAMPEGVQFRGCVG